MDSPDFSRSAHATQHEPTQSALGRYVDAVFRSESPVT